MKKVIKRDGTTCDYDRTRIVNAVDSAFREVYGTTSGKSSNACWILAINNVEHAMEESNKDTITVDEIQDIVEKSISEAGEFEVAKCYILYRNERTRRRSMNLSFIKNSVRRNQGSGVANSNANVDEESFSGMEKESSCDYHKYLALENYLSPKIADAHRSMYVYNHDLEKASFGYHNCLNVDLSILEKGFSTRNGDVRGARSFSTACQQTAVVFQCQSQVQFGGVGSVHIDYDLAPFVKMSFRKAVGAKLYDNYMKSNYDEVKHIKSCMDEDHYNDWRKDKIKELLIGMEEQVGPIEMSNELFHKNYEYIYDAAMDDVNEDGLQSCQGFYHNLNTLESRQGSQVPFTSINFGRDTSIEGRKVTQWMLMSSLDGIGELHRTSIFPISIFQWKKGINVDKDDPNYDLKRLALLSLSKRIYPNWVNCDWSEAHEDPSDPDTYFSTMGCRTLVGYDRHGYGYKRVGRGNAIPCTMILPQLGIKYGICTGKRQNPDLEGFWKEFDLMLQTCEEALLERFSIMVSKSTKAGPFMYKNGTAVDTDKCDNSVYNTLKHFSLAIGYIGLNELCVALFGKNFVHDKNVLEFAISVVKKIHDYAVEASERNDLNFVCYATPAEGLCHASLKALRKQHGIIKGVTDREYLTNSHHVPVWENVSIFEKLEIESKFCKYPTGGCITYVELDSGFSENLDGIEKIIDYAFGTLNIPYLAFNFPIDTCLDCGYQGDIPKGSSCPCCKSSRIERLRRVTGYITTDYSNFNDGKIAEVEDRVKHSLITDINDDVVEPTDDNNSEFAFNE